METRHSLVRTTEIPRKASTHGLFCMKKQCRLEKEVPGTMSSPVQRYPAPSSLLRWEIASPILTLQPNITALNYPIRRCQSCSTYCAVIQGQRRLIRRHSGIEAYEFKDCLFGRRLAWFRRYERTNKVSHESIEMVFDGKLQLASGYPRRGSMKKKRILAKVEGEDGRRKHQKYIDCDGL